MSTRVCLSVRQRTDTGIALCVTGPRPSRRSRGAEFVPSVRDVGRGPVFPAGPVPPDFRCAGSAQGAACLRSNSLNDATPTAASAVVVLPSSASASRRRVETYAIRQRHRRQRLTRSASLALLAPRGSRVACDRRRTRSFAVSTGDAQAWSAVIFSVRVANPRHTRAMPCDVRRPEQSVRNANASAGTYESRCHIGSRYRWCCVRFHLP